MTRTRLTSRGWPSTAFTRGRAIAARPVWWAGSACPKTARVSRPTARWTSSTHSSARRGVNGGRRSGLGELAAILLRVQHELFNLGSILATLPDDVHPRQPRVTDAEIAQLEAEMDRMNEDLAPLRSFVLPGGSRIDAELHIARTVCRRAERACIALGRTEGVPPEAIRYLNRLSDALFVWSRWAGHQSGAPETLWEPNQSASGNE